MLIPGGSYKTVLLQSAAVAVGNGTVMGCTDVSGGALTAVAMQVTGITTATITFEATIDGSNWLSILAENVTTGAEATTAAANGIYRVMCLGMVQVRARISSWTSGTITITGVAIA